MLKINPDLINSCRVCRSPNQDGDYECLYQNLNKHEEATPMLSEAGILYENLLNISLSNWDNYPQFLCNSCDLQMKLFKKLKDKAFKTWEYLQNLYDGQNLTKQEVVEENLEILEECEQVKTSTDDQGNNDEYPGSEANDYHENETDGYQEHITNEYQANIAEEYDELNSIVEEYKTNSTKELYQTNLTEGEYQTNLAEEEKEYQKNSNKEDYQTNLAIENEENPSNEYLTINSCQTEDQLDENNLYSEDNLIPLINTNLESPQNSQIFSSQNSPLNIPSLNLEIEPKITDFKFHYSTVEIQEHSGNSLENIPQIRIDLEPVIDKNDYVTEIYELLEDEGKNESCTESNDHAMEYDVYTDDKTDCSNSMISEVEYIIEEEMCDEEYNQNMKNTLEIVSLNVGKRRQVNMGSKRRCVEGSISRKREYKCEPCQLDFKNLQDLKMHRAEIHNEKYPCTVCGKELKTLPSLHMHMKIHADQPAHQCEICQKTFNQKAHYQYHMKRHNNERNFKCNECEKAFITKTDLKVHQRLHTGQRPYVCNICNKDYLMMEHLKAHLLTHTDQYFECDICKHKFATHKTLRQHVKTIHEDEPRFKCSFCSKPFRRKHHLEYHLRLHQKNVKLLDSNYELVDDPTSIVNYPQEEQEEDDPNDLTDRDLIVDSGFIALNDDII